MKNLIYLLSLLGVIHLNAQTNSSSQPNILFIIADDLTYTDIGCYGSKNVQTPNIDAIAAEGMRFKRAFQAAPMCSPTRHNLYTGIYPVRNGAYPNHAYAKKGTKSIAHYLKDAGYRVALTGKTHIAPAESFPFDYLSKTKNPDHKALEAFITQDKNQPFCAFVCYREPHTPWILGDPSLYDPDQIEFPPYLVDTKETRKRLTEYYAEINHLDNSVGELIAMLDKHGLAENTLLIFTSEQGNAFPFAKWTCYDNGLRTALIARWPGKIPANSTTNAMVEYVDITPTLVDVAGQKPIKDLDGKSFLSVFWGERDSHKKLVYGIQTTRGINNGSEHYGIRSVRSEHYKYIINLTPEATFQNNATVVNAPWASFWPTWVEKGKSDAKAKELVYRFQHRPSEEFYDIVDDPFEMNNLANDPSFQKEKKKLRKKLYAWMRQQGDLGQETEMEALEHKVSFLKKK